MPKQEQGPTVCDSGRPQNHIWYCSVSPAPTTKDGVWRGLQAGFSLAESMVGVAEAPGEFWQLVGAMATWVDIPNETVTILIIAPIK